MSATDPFSAASNSSESELIRLAADEVSNAIYITDAKAVLIYVNRTFTQMFGYEPAEVLGRPGREVLGTPHYKEADYARIWAELNRGRELREEVRTLDKVGEEIWVSLTLRPLFGDDGKLKHLVATMENTTEARQIQALQRDVLEAVAQDRPLTEVMEVICTRVEAMFPEVVSSILAVDREGALRPLAGPQLSPTFTALVDGVSIGPAVGSCGTAAFRGEPVEVEDIETDPKWLPYNALPLAQGLRACWSSPIKLRDGRVAGTFAFYFHERRGPSASHERVVAACLHLCVLAIDRHQAQADIAKLAYYDTLTGLPNRSMLRRELDAAFVTTPGEVRAFLFLDVDRFKDVNDTMGHSVGDDLLVEVARRLQQQVGPGDIVCRHGGDEFVIVLDKTTPEAAAAMAERVGAALLVPTKIPGLAVPITASIGVSLYPRDGADADTLLKNADSAMYQAKAEGRARHSFFSAEMNLLAQERLTLGAALRGAVSRRELHLRYQPQVSATDGSLLGVEALARWTHAELGEIPPDRFIRLAEESGLVGAIGEWAVDEACRQLRRWDDTGFRVPGVSVNISALHFRLPELPGVVAEALRRATIAPERLTIEITEGVAMDDSPVAIENAKALRALGVGLSMDDFGTGYSSLSHLARLPVNELKIDRSFMQGLESSDSSRTLVTAVIRIGQSLGMRVVAEGVETDAQRRFLQALDCDVLQGFLFARALLPVDLEAWAGARTEPVLERGAA